MENSTGSRVSLGYTVEDIEKRGAVEVPPIIERETFDKVRRSLKARNPRSTPPRVTTGSILLTGLAYCASCRRAMTLRTGSKVNLWRAASTGPKSNASAP